MEEISWKMAKGKTDDCTELSYQQKMEVQQKEKKKQKKKNVLKYGKPKEVSHIPTRQTNNKLLLTIFKN
jgi:hypothetical protein